MKVDIDTSLRKVVVAYLEDSPVSEFILKDNIQVKYLQYLEYWVKDKVQELGNSYPCGDGLDYFHRSPCKS
jgi:hypothetical protein